MSGFALVALVLIVALIIIGSFALGGILAAPWVPLPKRDVERMLKLSQIKAGQQLVDLGCGDGRILLTAAKNYNARAIGYEVAVLPFLASYFKIIQGRAFKNVKVIFGNFYKNDLGSADVVTAFLSPWAMKKLKNKLQTELKKGSLVVSYAFKIPDWKPMLVDKPAKNQTSIYVYKVE